MLSRHDDRSSACTPRKLPHAASLGPCGARRCAAASLVLCAVVRRGVVGEQGLECRDNVAAGHKRPRHGVHVEVAGQGAVAAPGVEIGLSKVDERLGQVPESPPRRLPGSSGKSWQSMRTALDAVPINWGQANRWDRYIRLHTDGLCDGTFGSIGSTQPQKFG